MSMGSDYSVVYSNIYVQCRLVIAVIRHKHSRTRNNFLKASDLYVWKCRAVQTNTHKYEVLCSGLGSSRKCVLVCQQKKIQIVFQTSFAFNKYQVRYWKKESDN